MEKTGKQKHLYFMRVSENCKLLTELYVVPDEVNHQQSWFEDRHLQEIIILLRDPIKSKVVSYYEQYRTNRRKKWSGIKEGNDSKKKPIPDEHQITTGQSVKIGYKFVDSNLHHPSCLMPTKMGTPVWKDDNSRHAGGGFSPVRLFAKKLVVFVCKYHTATIGQTTSQLMKSLCATPPSKHIAISSYFAPKADADFVGPPAIQSAHRKRNKLKKLVKGMNTAAATAGTKESIEVGGGLKGGGFFEKASGNMDTEPEDEIKPEVLPFPSVSDMDCDSDGMPDPEELNERLDGDHRSPAECKDGLSLRHGDHSRRSLPLSPPQEERSWKTTVKPDEDPIKVEGNEHPQFSDVSKPFTCKLEKIEDALVDLPQKADLSSSERTSSPSTYESRLKGSLNSIKSEATLQSSSVKQESGVTRLTCSSEVTGSSPSSSGEFDHRIKRRENTRSRNKLSLKRNEAKRGSASKFGSSKEKVLHEDVKKESVEEALMGQEMHGSKKQKLHNDTVPEKDRVSVNKRSNNISESVRHPTGNCSVLLTDIKLKHDERLGEHLRSTTSSLKRPMKNQQDISPSPEKETTRNSSSDDDELMSASFLHAENRPLNPAKEVKESRQQLSLQTTQYGERKVNGVSEVDTASSGCEQRDSFHSTTNKSVQNVEDNENTKQNKRPKLSKLALFLRQNKRDKDSLHNIPKALHGEKKRKQKTNIGQLMEDLDWDSDSQGTNENQRTSEVIHSRKIEDKLRRSEEDEPMDVEDELPKLTPIEDVGCAFDEVEALPSDRYNLDDYQDGPSPPELKRDDPVHISDDSCNGDVMDDIQVEEDENALMGAGREGKLGDLEDEVIDLSQGKDDDESDSWFDNIFGNVRLVTELKTADIVYLTQRNKRYLHNIFQGKRACERHQCYKKKGPHRIGMASNVRLGPFSEEQMDAVMGELVKTYCARHFKYMDYLSKVLLPEAMSKIYMDVHGVSHAHAEEVMKGLRKERPRGT